MKTPKIIVRWRSGGAVIITNKRRLRIGPDDQIRKVFGVKIILFNISRPKKITYMGIRKTRRAKMIKFQVKPGRDKFLYF